MTIPSQENRKKHILLLFQHFRTPKDMGGLRSWHIGRRLVRDGFEVEAIIPAVDGLSDSRKRPGLFLRTTETIEGVKINWANALSSNRTSKASRIASYISSSFTQALLLFLVPKPDLVMSMSLPLPSLVSAFAYAKVRRVPLVVDVRDTHIDSAVATGYIKEGRLVRFLNWLEGLVFRKADLNIVVTGGMAKIISDKGVSRERLQVVPLGYDGDECYEGCVDWTRDIRAELGLERKFIALYSGTLGFVFDLDTILGAAECLKEQKDIVFVFAGGGQRLDELALDAEKKGLNALFLGQLPKHDVPLLCRQADVALYAVRDREPLKAILGNKVFDYLGNGIPVVNASQGGDVAALLACSGGGISVPSSDAFGMAMAIQELRDSPEKRSRMGRSGRSYVDRHMKAEHSMQALSRAIQAVLGGVRTI